jgi:hypothetical protein
MTRRLQARLSTRRRSKALPGASTKTGTRLIWTALLGVSLALAVAPPAFAGALISNGTVKLGVNDHGELNFRDPATGEFRGVTYVPTDHDGTRGGCPCEGWGAGAGGPIQFQGRANQSLGGASGLMPVSFESTASTATSVADVLRLESPALRVTHQFKPSPQTANLYEIEITLRNLTTDTLTNVRYERVMDWDIEPTATSEFVTINRGPTPPSDLFYSDDNGFSDNFPFTFAPDDPPDDSATVNANYTDKGPADHGARFTFDFGSLTPSAEKTFVLFYGAAGSEAQANSAVSAAALEMFSYGQPNVPDSADPDTIPDGPGQGLPSTFIWGFRAVGGSPVIPPTLTLSPSAAEVAVGNAHTVTATLTTSAGGPVPGAKIVFLVEGANPRSADARTTDGSGQAGFAYPGANAGADTLTACFDSNDNDACDPEEITAVATRTTTGRDTTPPDTPITSAPPASGEDRTPTFAFGSSEPGSRFECSLDGGPFGACSSPFTTGRLAVGRHTFAVRAIDAAGNVDPTPSVYTFEIAAAGVADLPKPQQGVSVNVQEVSGTVLVGIPAGAASTARAGGKAKASQKGINFVPLSQARQIPVGSFLDTSRGTVRLQSARNLAGARQTGDFNGSIFQVKQSRKRSTKGLTDLVLKGASFRRCATGARGKGATAAANKATIRRLQGNANGRFRTRGRYSSATVRGTSWGTFDRCDGTLTKVRRGRVVVRDFRRKRNILLTAGKTYLARAPR